ncbi:O-antigen ligase family protein [uncultured Ruegeria sp.]|uniref:O-antigen ligase family protein n=1 Tax=uncultured Ruegeria sp. TaxID=259304 RepID=UPI002635684A|nr:O-antigen ligase family protein [uncultured Ruegeria sp.]
MNVKLASIIDPAQNTAYVVPAVALSMIVFAYSVNFGPLSILAFYGVWLLPFALAPRILLGRPGAVVLLLLLPFFFLLSTLWSDVPSATLRASIQYGITFFAGLVAARITSPGNLALGGTIGCLLVLLYSAVNWGYSYDYIDGDFAFNGAFSSKNQLGYFATLAIIFALSVVGVFRAPRMLLPMIAVTAATGFGMLWMSDSATSLLSALVAFSSMLFVGLVMLLAPWLRRATVVLALAGIAALVLAAQHLGAFDAVLAAFGKDTTLTGRTYLWNQAFEIGANQRVLGLGYNAFWVPGRPEAEALWDTFYITARSGFHFHNALIETYVGTGLVGLGFVTTICVLLVVMPLSAVFGRGNVGSLMFFSGLAVLFLVRSVAEVDFVTPHTVGSFLVAFILLRLFDHNRNVRHAAFLSRPTPSAQRPSLSAATGVFE